MNKQLQDFARKTLKEGLALCTKDQQQIFRQMYARPDKRMDMGADINTVVDEMSPSTLDWAMQQIQRTLEEKNDQNK